MRTLLITIVVSSFLAVTALGCGKDKAADPAPAAENGWAWPFWCCRHCCWRWI